jgi:hypothetical protein
VQRQKRAVQADEARRAERLMKTHVRQYRRTRGVSNRKRGRHAKVAQEGRQRARHGRQGKSMRVSRARAETMTRQIEADHTKVGNEQGD